MAGVLQVKQEPTSVTMESRLENAQSNPVSNVNLPHPLTLEQVAIETDEPRRFELLNSYLSQLATSGHLEKLDVVRDANYLRKLVRSENGQLQIKVSELLLHYLRMMKLDTTYDQKLAGIQDSMLLYKLYQVVHDDSCYYLLPNVKAGETFNKFLCSLLATASSDYVFNSVVKLFQRTVENVLSKYKKESGSYDEMKTEDIRVVIAVMKTLLTLTRAFGSPPAPAQLLCSLSVTVANSTKAHLCRLYSYNLIAFLIRDVTDKPTLDKLLNGLNSTQYNQVTALVKESNSLSNICNWKYKYAPANDSNKTQNTTSSSDTTSSSFSQNRQHTPNLSNRDPTPTNGKNTADATTSTKRPHSDYVNTREQSENARKRPLNNESITSPQNNKRSLNSSTSSDYKESGELKKHRTEQSSELPSNWYKDLFKKFDTNRGEGKSVVVDKNAWKWKNDELLNTLKMLEKYDKVDLDSVSANFVKLFETLLKYESAIPVVINSLNLFTVLLVKGNCDFLSVSKSQLLSDLLFEKLKDGNRKVRDACVQALVEVVKRCKLPLVSDSVKKALVNVSPTCRENMCNFLNGRLLTEMDDELFEKLKELLSMLSDQFKQMTSDKVPKVRQAVGSVLEVLKDFSLLRSNLSVSTGTSNNSTLYSNTSNKIVREQSPLNNEQEFLTTVEAAVPSVDTTGRSDTFEMTTTAASYVEPEPRSEFSLDETDPKYSSSSSSRLDKPDDISVSNTLNTNDQNTDAHQNKLSSSDTDSHTNSSPNADHTKAQESVATSTEVAADSSTRVDEASKSNVSSVNKTTDVSAPQKEPSFDKPASKNDGVDAKTSLDPKKLMAVDNLADIVDSEVLDEFRKADKMGLAQALYRLCLWMDDNRRVVKSVDFYLLKVINEFYSYFTDKHTKRMFFSILFSESLSDDAFSELLSIVDKYKDAKVLGFLVAKNNLNTDRLLDPLSDLYYDEPTGLKVSNHGSKHTHSNLATTPGVTSSLANRINTTSKNYGQEPNNLLVNLLELLGKLVSETEFVLKKDLLMKLVDFGVYFVELKSDRCSSLGMNLLWNLDQKYQVSSCLDNPMTRSIKLFRPSKQLTSAYWSSSSTLEKYVSKDLFKCMFQQNIENKKRSCVFWKVFLSKGGEKCDNMLLGDVRKELTCWLSYSMFENKCDKPVLDVFDLIVNYLSTRAILFNVEETLFLVESFCSYSTFGKYNLRALSVFNKMTRILTYSLETVDGMMDYMESVEDQWAEVLRTALNRAVKRPSTDELLISRVEKRLKSSPADSNDMNQKLTSWVGNLDDSLNKKELSSSVVPSNKQVDKSDPSKVVEQQGSTSDSTVDQPPVVEDSSSDKQTKQKDSASSKQDDTSTAVRRLSDQKSVVSIAETNLLKSVSNGVKKLISAVADPSVSHASQPLSNLSEKYKMAMESLETVHQEIDNTLEQVSTNDSVYESGQNFPGNFYESSHPLASNTVDEPLKQPKAASTDSTNSVAPKSVTKQASKPVDTVNKVPESSVQKSGVSEVESEVNGSFRRHDTVQNDSNKNDSQSVSRSKEPKSSTSVEKPSSSEAKLLDQVILDEDVTLDLESCKRLSQQIVETPTSAVKDADATQPEYNSHRTASSKKNKDVSLDSTAKVTSVENQTRRDFGTNTSVDYRQRASNGFDKSTETSAQKPYEQEFVSSSVQHAEKQVETLVQQHYEKQTATSFFMDFEKYIDSTPLDRELDKGAGTCDKQTSTDTVEHTHDNTVSSRDQPATVQPKSYNKEVEKSVPRSYAEQSSTRLSDKLSGTGNFTPSAVLDPDKLRNYDERREHLETVSDNSKDKEEESSVQLLLPSVGSKTARLSSVYKKDDSTGRDLSTRSNKSVGGLSPAATDPNLNIVENVLSHCSRINNLCLLSSYKEYQKLVGTLYPGDISSKFSESFKYILRNKAALKGTLLRLLSPPLIESSHNAVLLLSKLVFKSVQIGEPWEHLLDAMSHTLEVFKLVTKNLEQKFVLQFSNVVTNLLALPKEMYKNERLYSLVSSMVADNALKQSTQILYKMLVVMVELSMESLDGELDRLLMAKLRFTKILQMQILLALKENEATPSVESELLRSKHMDFIARLENFSKRRRAQNVEKVIRTSNYIISTI